MTPVEKRVFIDEIVNNVHSSIANKINAMPDDWDGIELRQYLALHFAQCVISGTMNTARKRRFNNEVLTRNL